MKQEVLGAFDEKINKGLEAGSTQVYPMVVLGAKHRKHGKAMNRDQSGDRS